MTEHHDRSAASERDALATRLLMQMMDCDEAQVRQWSRYFDRKWLVAIGFIVNHVPDAAQPTQEPVAWQWRAPLSGKWYTDDTPDDPKVQKRLKDEGYQFRPLYASQPSPAATVEIERLRAESLERQEQICETNDRLMAAQDQARCSAGNGGEIEVALSECRDFLADLVGGARFDVKADHHAKGLIEQADAALTLAQPQSSGNEDVRWAVNVLLEKVAAKFEAWDTFDLFRSEAAGTVRSFKHDLSTTEPQSVQVTDEMVTAAMRAFEPMSSVPRYREKDKWHSCDIMGMRDALKAALAVTRPKPSTDR